VQGIGGLGHLGIQFANKFGYKVVAVGRGSQIEPLAMKLGADVYIDSRAKNPVEELAKTRRRKSHYRDSAGLQGNGRTDCEAMYRSTLLWSTSDVPVSTNTG
jgi:Zn-dependent alcohol dehydrogenase